MCRATQKKRGTELIEKKRDCGCKILFFFYGKISFFEGSYVLTHVVDKKFFFFFFEKKTNLQTGRLKKKQ